MRSAQEKGEVDPASFLLGASVVALVAYALWLKAQEAREARERRYDPRFPQDIGM